jgi:putative phosphoesterase
LRLGLIADTHGLLRPEVFHVFQGVDRILHAGDVGDADVLAELEVLAPVTAVWGNTDGFALRERLPEVFRTGSKA